MALNRTLVTEVCGLYPDRDQTQLESTILNPSVDEVATTYSHATSRALADAERALFKSFWLKDLLPLMVDAYPRVTLGAGRAAILSRLLRHARGNPKIISLAVSALNDRAYIVREHACSILAYSLDDNAIPSLVPLRSHKDPKTVADANAAIDAISHSNHHFYVDREHTGSVRWGVKPSDLRES